MHKLKLNSGTTDEHADMSKSTVRCKYGTTQYKEYLVFDNFYINIQKKRNYYNQL